MAPQVIFLANAYPVTARTATETVTQARFRRYGAPRDDDSVSGLGARSRELVNKHG